MSVCFSPAKNRNRLYFRCLMVPLAAIFLSCCSGSSPPAEKTAQKPSRSFFRVIGDTFVGSLRGAVQAVQAPLEDANLKRQSIPDHLKQMTNNPYALPTPLNCSTVVDGIVQLNGVLGPERVFNDKGANDSLVKAWDHAHNISWKDKDKYIDSGSSFIQEKVADEVRTHVDLIPYRSWLRWVSGADAHAKRVAEAYEAGKLHRAFLRGVAVNLHCEEELAKQTQQPPVSAVKKEPVAEEKQTALNE
ncbi:MAG TPA: hypothetical protein VFT64_06100 [Rickettsiales bacterium]|nr:hypothetical protein [Rickettsiales bacterium]